MAGICRLYAPGIFGLVWCDRISPIPVAAVEITPCFSGDLATRHRPQDDHDLLTHGVYRYIRHPMHAAYLLWGLAQGLLLPNWIAGPALLAVFLVRYLSQVEREEQLLLAFFRNEYQTYMASPGRIIPRLRRA